MKKEILHTTKLMATSLLLILLIPLAYSLEFGLDSPKTVNLNEEFTATINADTSDIYDVKIFVHEPIKKFSEIYDNSSWRSPHLYLNSAFPEQKEFKIISHYQGETKICARLRKSGEISFKETCNEIIVNPASSQEPPIKSDNNSNNKDEESINDLKEPSLEETKNKEQESKQSQKQEEKTRQNKSQQQIENIASENTSSQKTQEKLVLNPKSKKPLRILNSSKIQNQENFTTKHEKIRLTIIYSFIAICVFIIILLALKKL